MDLKRFLTRSAALAIVMSAAGTAVASDVVTRKNGKTIVEAPTTRVVTNERSGETRVKVRAPSSRIDVDTARGQVRIRVPYYNANIRW